MFKKEEKREEIEKSFKKYDLDSSGSINVSEFDALCKDLGWEMDEGERKAALDSLDSDGGGQIGFAEFLAWHLGEEVRGSCAACHTVHCMSLCGHTNAW